MFNRFILFLIRKRYGLKKYECFRFYNQKSSAVYFFGHYGIYKWWHHKLEKSHVSLNWLLDDECYIISCEGSCEDLKLLDD